MPQTKQRVFGLDLMRACAVIGVMYLHSGYMFGRTWPRGAEAAMIGIETFFALSGFLVGAIALRLFLNGGETRQIKSFLVRRWLRTLPAYYVFLALNLWLAHGSFDWKFLFFLQTMGGKEPLPYFNESWTLAVEEWFYVLLPIVLLLIVRFAPKRPLILMFGFIAMSITARYILLGPMAMFWRDTYHITFLCLDAIMFGVIAAYIKQSRPDLWLAWKWPCLVLGLALLAVPFPTQPATPIINATLYQRYAFGAALILPAMSSWVHAPLFLAPIRWIALISYSLYLTHLPVAAFLRHRGYVDPHGELLTTLAIWIAVTFAVATASYFAIERQGMRIAEKLNHSGARMSAGSPPAAVTSEIASGSSAGTPAPLSSGPASP